MQLWVRLDDPTCQRWRQLSSKAAIAAPSAQRLAATLLNLPIHDHNALGTPASSTMCWSGLKYGDWRKSMALKKKVAAKRQVWNKGVEVGKRDAFTPTQVKRIRGVLADRGVSGLRDLALFSVAIDTMLQGPELLALTVKDVQLPNGTIRAGLKVARTRRPPVRC